MSKYPLMGGSICAVALIVLGSMTNAVGYQTVSVLDNQPPRNPEIMGPAQGKVGITYLFTVVATDPEKQNVSYYIEWGDGTHTGWTPYYQSGQTVCYSHRWYKINDYPVRCKAKDTMGAESNWSYIAIPIMENSGIAQPSNQENTPRELNEKEALFQTIVGMVNNKESPCRMRIWLFSAPSSLAM
jgi:hypothetical protein